MISLPAGWLFVQWLTSILLVCTGLQCPLGQRFLGSRNADTVEHYTSVLRTLTQDSQVTAAAFGMMLQNNANVSSQAMSHARIVASLCTRCMSQLQCLYAVLCKSSRHCTCFLKRISNLPLQCSRQKAPSLPPIICHQSVFHSTRACSSVDIQGYHQQCEHDTGLNHDLSLKQGTSWLCV